MTQNISIDKRLDEYLGQARPTLVEFGRPGRNEDTDVMARLGDTYAGRANVMAIDGSQSQDLVRAYKIITYPTFILFKDGQEAWRDAGHKTYEELDRMIRDFV
ncbi:MAG: thioredoxin family protein [Muribaculaceae bacterium]|nr:thioredoxin family protein [Muribaculaceae bacterium]